MKKNDENDIKLKKYNVNQKHIDFYDKVLEILGFMLDEYSRGITRADIDFIDVPKNTLSVFDFLISSIIKVQKGQRLALGLDEEEFEDTSPTINIIKNLDEKKI